ncbi:hypothetical protein [Paraburkholderia sp. GAS42]|jgi:hypothetical protein|uniref:hypothetical protein n=1 Tax=Paraburkholderia sp. GAS42 TaxID=3035135 RepID=UPI003D1CD7D8
MAIRISWLMSSSLAALRKIPLAALLDWRISDPERTVAVLKQQWLFPLRVVRRLPLSAAP